MAHAESKQAEGHAMVEEANPVIRASSEPRPSAGRRDSGAGPAIFQQLDSVNPYPYSLREYAWRGAWELIGKSMIRLSLRKAARWRRFWLRLFGGEIDSTSHFKRTTRIHHPWLLKVGRHSAIAEGVEVYNLGPITIGDHSVISQRAHLCAGTHDYRRPNLPLQRPPITIGSGVWVCAEAFVGPGVTIGDNSIVGARAVVLRDVPAGVIVAGNPARVLGPRPMPADAGQTEGGSR